MILAGVLLLILLNFTTTTTNLRAAPTTTNSSPMLTSAPEAEPFIKKIRFQVPESVRLGNTIKLTCFYELSGASLHAMKLFKDDKEFYRYTPPLLMHNEAQANVAPAAAAAEEQRIAFASAGLRVDLTRSNDQDIWIKILDKRAAGTYKCQVSIEDTFKSISAEKRMDVIEKQQRVMPSPSSSSSGVGAAISNWLGANTQPPQRQNTVQPNSGKSRAQASFMQQQPTSAPATQSNGALGRNHSLATTMTFCCCAIVGLMILIMHRK